MKDIKMERKKFFWVALCVACRGDYRLMEKISRQFPDIGQAFEVKEAELRLVGLGEGVVEPLVSGKALQEAKKITTWLNKNNYWLLYREESDYPPLLKEISYPPFLLFGGGQKELLRQPAVAVVGTRHPSLYGRSMAEKLSSDLAVRGLVVVSGLARGIDALAHAAALNAGKTVAILGSGLKKIYPPENIGLFQEIISKGAVITEYPPDEPPLAHHFPWRNRLISGLSLATVVVEASARSGSLITAKLALDQNREVMAVPGRAGGELSQGTNGLIKAGAKLVETWEDVVLELPSEVRDAILFRDKLTGGSESELEALKEEEKMVLETLTTEEALALEEIVTLTGRPVAELLSVLLQLELKGLVTSGPGPSFQRRG